MIHRQPYDRTNFRGPQQRSPEVAAGAVKIETLYGPDRAIELYMAALGSSEWPMMDFSVKSLAKFCGFKWRDTDLSGASSIEWFDRWAKTGDPALKQRLLDYNEDDCVAMRVVLDAMKGLVIRP